MLQRLYIKICGSSLILLTFIVVGLFVLVVPVFAVGGPDSIIINIQPFSTTSVDFALSQQPVLLVRDVDKKPVPGVVVTAFKNSGTGTLRGNRTVTTDVNGLASFQSLGYDKTDSFTILFTSGETSIISNLVQLFSGAASVSKSSISVSPVSVVADGESVATVKIVCKDQYNNIISDARAGISATGSDNTLGQSNITDDFGVITIDLSSTKSESKLISVSISGVFIGKSNPINFIPGKVAKLSISADSPVNTENSSKVIIIGKDKFDNIVINDSATQVALSVDNGGSLDSALVTFSSGIASALLSKKSPGIVNFIASNGSINATSKIVFVPADNIAPIILSQFPPENITGVAIDITPYINFSKTMNTTTMTNENIQLRKFLDDSFVSVAILIANGGKRVILQPDSNLDFDTKYYLYISTSVEDLVGNALSSAYISNAFTTVAESVIPSVTQEQGNTQSSGANFTNLTQNDLLENTINNSGTITFNKNNTISQEENLSKDQSNLFTAGLLGVSGNYFWTLLILFVIISIGYGIYYLIKKRKE